MRVAVVLLSVLIFTGVAYPQSPTDPAIELVKFSWSKERLNWEGNPFGGPNENFHQMQFRARSEKRVSDAKRSNSAEVGKLEKDAAIRTALVQLAGRMQKARSVTDGSRNVVAVPDLVRDRV